MASITETIIKELIGHLKAGEEAIRGILGWLDDHKLDLPGHLDLEEILGTLKFMGGYVTCLGRYGSHSSSKPAR